MSILSKKFEHVELDGEFEALLPKLFNANKYSSWKPNFIHYIRTQDFHMWICISMGYEAPTRTKSGVSEQMNELEKRLYEAENRAFSVI